MKEGRGHPAAARAVGLTRAGMWWEALARAFWPLGVVLALVLAALAFGATELFSNAALVWAMGLVALAILLGAGWGIWRFRVPTLEHAWARVDETLPGRPLSARMKAFSRISGKRCAESTRQTRLQKGR